VPRDKKKSVKRPPQAPARQYGPLPPGARNPGSARASKTPEQLAGKMRKVH
jgi:hypothetical protein